MYKTKIEKLQLKDLTQFPDNPQEVPADKMKLIVKNMKEKGWIGEWSTVWRNKKKLYVISGNHRVIAALEAGITEHEFIVIDDPKYTWIQAKKDCIMYNSLHGDPDEDNLKDFIESLLSEHKLDIESIADDIGMSEFDIKDILDDCIEKYKDLDNQLNELEGYEDVDIKITIPKKYENRVIKFLANGESLTSTGIGRGTLKRCGLL